MAPAKLSLVFKVALFATVLASMLTLGMSNEVKSADSLPAQIQPVYTILRRQLRSYGDDMTYADKRDVDNLWQDCQFSPMSCLLRRRRRAVQMPAF